MFSQALLFFYLARRVGDEQGQGNKVSEGVEPATACRAIAYPAVSRIKHRIGEMETLGESDEEAGGAFRSYRGGAVPGGGDKSEITTIQA